MEYEFKLSDENYTPEELVSEVRHVLETIDLDPASCAQAQALIRAGNYFSAEKNPNEAFNTPWQGRVFLNPPYSRGEVTRWLDRLGAQLCEGRTKAAMVITSNDTTAKWFQFIWGADRLVFPNRRIGFYGPNNHHGTNRAGNVISLFVGPETKPVERAGYLARWDEVYASRSKTIKIGF